MANVRLNPILEQIRGAVGDLVFKRYEERVILSRKPDASGRPPTPAQAAQRERFRQAALYGRVVMADPEARAFYEGEADERHVPLFSLTIADFFNAPEITEVDVADYHGARRDVIRITAMDDVGVARVEVSITTADGTVVETGEAVEEGGHWRYEATASVAAGTEVRIEVRAYDRPGGMDAETAKVTTTK